MVKIGLSKRRHLPVIKIGNSSFPLWEYFAFRGVEKTGLKLDEMGTIVIWGELPCWEEYYLPTFSLKGKIVLDIGACCGETAWFFLKHGAAKVICIEPDPARVKLMEENKNNLNLNIEIINDKFRPEYLSIPHDFMKCDIEGYEIELLPFTETLKPCVIEIHCWWIKDQFEKKGFMVLTEFNQMAGTCLMINYPRKK